MNFTRSNFSGGMNLRYEPTKLGESEYPLLINGRNRDGTIRPVKKPDLVAGAPGGNYQGLYASNELLLIVSDGIPFVANIENGTQFGQIVGATLNATSPTVWAAAVPKSTINFARIASATDTNEGARLTTPIPQTEASVVLTDNGSRAVIIESNGTGRVANNYNQWTKENREYVPVGGPMLYADGILYMLATNGREIYRSIKGRPLDFMINVNSKDGDKMGTEQDGGASTVSHAVGYDPVTCLAELNSSDNPIFVGGNRYSVKVVPTAQKIFGEPRFSNLTLMPTGPVNQFSFAESNGDNVFINARGVRSFNAAAQMNNRGDNSPFSARVNKLFRDLIQANTCCVKFDDYVLFSIQTIYGAAVLVYDELSQVFVGLDMYAGVGAIKQFARVTINNMDRLFFITTDSKLYEAFVGTETETCRIYIGEFSSGNAKVQIKPAWLHTALINARTTGTLSMTPYVNRKMFSAQSRNIVRGVAEATPEVIPFTPAEFAANGVQTFSFDLGRCHVGWKFGVLLELTGDVELSDLTLITEDQAPLNTAQNEAKEWRARS